MLASCSRCCSGVGGAGSGGGAAAAGGDAGRVGIS